MTRHPLSKDETLRQVNIHLSRGLAHATCTKRAIGSVLQLYNGRFIYGYNGPPHSFKRYCIPCPRADEPSGERMDLCPAIHAEMAPILRTAQMGLSTMNATLYITCGLPCKDCMKELINAGIGTIVSPYPLEVAKRSDGFKASSYGFNLSYRMMKAAGIEYVHQPYLIRGKTAHVVVFEP